MRTLTAIVVAISLVSASAVAATRAPAALPAGQAAGVKQAALIGPSLWFALLSTAVLVGGVAMTVGSNDVNKPTTVTTTTTAP